MKARRIVVLAAALTAVSALTGPVASASAAVSHGTIHPAFVGRERGYGPTLAAATLDGKQQMLADYVGCKQPFYVVSSGQLSDGSWWADVNANGCTGIR